MTPPRTCNPWRLSLKTSRSSTSACRRRTATKDCVPRPKSGAAIPRWDPDPLPAREVGVATRLLAESAVAIGYLSRTASPTSKTSSPPSGALPAAGRSSIPESSSTSRSEAGVRTIRLPKLTSRARSDRAGRRWALQQGERAAAVHHRARRAEARLLDRPEARAAAKRRRSQADPRRPRVRAPLAAISNGASRRTIKKPVTRTV